MSYPCTLPGCPGHAVPVDSHTTATEGGYIVPRFIYDDLRVHARPDFSELDRPAAWRVPEWVYRADTPPPADPDPVWHPQLNDGDLAVWWALATAAVAAALVAVLVVIGLRRYAS